MQIFEGRCHCGEVTIRFHTSIAPEELPLRVCQCSFCRKNGVTAASDPDGRFEISYNAEQKPQPYQFGLEIADFHICAKCGVNIAVTAETEGELLGVININALDDHNLFTLPPQPLDYDDEDKSERTSRRSGKWMPAKITG